MKTADLIPLILLQLNNGDKYGLEITKEIETASNGHIIIKQPTLYTILKKLEKSKFISSYWEDSDIGGKRHYYKITANGKAQVSTLPSFDELVKLIMSGDNEDTNEPIKDEDYASREEKFVTSSVPKTENHFDENFETSKKDDKYVSIMDILAESNASNDSSPLPSVLPTNEIFSSNSIDNATETDINLNNSSLLKNENEQSVENFASSEEVSKFTEKHTLSNEYKAKLKSLYSDKSSTQPIEYQVNKKDDEIEYVDYKDLKTVPEYVSSKRTIKNLVSKSLVTSAYMILTLIISSIITSFTGTSPSYYVVLILGIGFSIFYPAILIFNMDKLRLKYEFAPLKLNLKKRIILSIVLYVVLFIIVIILNTSIGIDNFASWSNYSNFYSILLSGTTIFMDLLFTYIFMNKLNKTKN